MEKNIQPCHVEDVDFRVSIENKDTVLKMKRWLLSDIDQAIYGLFGTHNGIVIGYIFWFDTNQDHGTLEIEAPMGLECSTLDFIAVYLRKKCPPNPTAQRKEILIKNIAQLLIDKMTKTGQLNTILHPPPPSTMQEDKSQPMVPSLMVEDKPHPMPPSPVEECVICMEEAPSTMVLPCNHCVVCRKCSEKLQATSDAKTCIYCRQPITHVLD